MKHRNSGQSRKTFLSLLIAVTMMAAAILPAGAVYASEDNTPGDSPGYAYSEDDPSVENDSGEKPEGYEADLPGGDILPENTDGDEEPAEPESADSPETTLKVGKDELAVTLSGDYSGEGLSLCVPESVETQKLALEEAIGAQAEKFRIVELRNGNGEPVALTGDDISVTVSGSWLSAYTKPVFALINDKGNVQIAGAKQETAEDGTSAWSFHTNSFFTLMIFEKGEPIPEETEEEKKEPEEAAKAAPARGLLGAGEADTIDMTVNIEWDGDEPTDKSSRPVAVYLYVERSTDGENWETYEQDIPFAITSFSDPAWTAIFSLPAKDDSGKPYTYRVRETAKGLGRYLVPMQDIVVTAEKPNILPYDSEQIIRC